MKKLVTFHDYLTERYGKALQRLSFDLGLSCPNRKSGNSSGCAFCSAKGARARHLPPDMTLEMQAERGKKYLHERYGFDGPYIAYFQAYTNTYAPLEVLKDLYGKVFSLAEFKMVIISTRPDCLPDDVLDYIASLQEKYDVFLELGVQSANDDTLKKINRGHDFACVEDAVRRASAKGIKCAA
ncbi:MAG: TIGR01212 family radical SAM protein, partial [Lentisphaeria bacterium]|nr:TIGR01212 family radical SAM protein [Lentisphaeria bacterium]